MTRLRDLPFCHERISTGHVPNIYVKIKNAKTGKTLYAAVSHIHDDMIYFRYGIEKWKNQYHTVYSDDNNIKLALSKETVLSPEGYSIKQITQDKWYLESVSQYHYISKRDYLNEEDEAYQETQLEIERLQKEDPDSDRIAQLIETNSIRMAHALKLLDSS